jgi:hypothetical protein
MVLQSHAKHAPGSRENLGRIDPRLHPPLQVLHPGLIPPLQPPYQGLSVLQRGEAGDSDAVEAGFQGPGLEEGGGGVHGGRIVFAWQEAKYSLSWNVARPKGIPECIYAE